MQFCKKYRVLSLFFVLLFFILTIFGNACTSFEDDIPLDALGRAGGLFRSEEGVLLEVPVGALREFVIFTVSIEKHSLPKGFVPLSSTFKVTPDGLTFIEGSSARLSLPILVSKLPKDRSLFDAVVFERKGLKWKQRDSTVTEFASLVSLDIIETGTFIVMLGPPKIFEPFATSEPSLEKKMEKSKSEKSSLKEKVSFKEKLVDAGSDEAIKEGRSHAEVAKEPISSDAGTLTERRFERFIEKGSPKERSQSEIGMEIPLEKKIE